jgi:hypothetical protein
LPDIARDEPSPLLPDGVNPRFGDYAAKWIAEWKGSKAQAKTLHRSETDFRDSHRQHYQRSDYDDLASILGLTFGTQKGLTSAFRICPETYPF